MAKLTYLGINNSSKKIASMYIGDNNGLSKKIVKAYIGDNNGFSRLVYSAEVIEPIILESPSLANSYNGDTFNWPAVANAIGYEVYRYSTLVATVTEPSYYTVQDGEYYVIAKGDGIYYLDSGPSYPFTIDSVQVDSFSIDNISSTTSDVTFSWDGSENVDYYSIYYTNTTGDGGWHHYTNTSDTSTTFSISAPYVGAPSVSVDYYTQGADIYWDEVEGASLYFVIDPNYKNIYQGTGTSCSLFYGSDPEGDYIVNAVGEKNSGIYQFNIDAHGPANSTYYYCHSDYYYPEDEVEMSATDIARDYVYVSWPEVGQVSTSVEYFGSGATISWNDVENVDHYMVIYESSEFEPEYYDTSIVVYNPGSYEIYAIGILGDETVDTVDIESAAVPTFSIGEDGYCECTIDDTNGETTYVDFEVYQVLNETEFNYIGGDNCASYDSPYLSSVDITPYFGTPVGVKFTSYSDGGLTVENQVKAGNDPDSLIWI